MLRDGQRALEAREEARAKAAGGEAHESHRLEAALHDAREGSVRERLQIEARHLEELGDALRRARKVRVRARGSGSG